MNLILLTEKDFIAKDVVRLKGRAFQHVTTILKAIVGQYLQMGLVNGKMGTGEILKQTKTFVDCKVSLTQKPPTPSPIRLVLALPRPIVLKRLLPQITALGIKDIVLVQTNRVEKSYWASPVLKMENMQEQIQLGLEQAKDTVFPKIQLRKRFKPFVEDELQGFAKSTKILVAHPEGKKSFPRRIKYKITLCVGPEGGFVPYEIGLLKAHGATVVQMGQRILKVETAVIGLLSILNQGSGNG